jgi:hypothetical protein
VIPAALIALTTHCEAYGKSEISFSAQNSWTINFIDALPLDSTTGKPPLNFSISSSSICVGAAMVNEGL